MPPAAPDPALSYHLSALYDGLSAVTATQQRPFGHNSMAHQYQETHRPRMEQHPVRAHAPSANPTSEIDPNRAQDRIRLNIVWDTASINVWLGLTEPSDTFFREFQTEIEKRKKIITDRALLTIIVSNEKSTPAERSYRMELAEDCLDADWDITKEWLEDNKRDKAPHIYGRVEVDEG